MKPIETVSDSTHPGKSHRLLKHIIINLLLKRTKLKRAKQLSKVIQMKRDS